MKLNGLRIKGAAQTTLIALLVGLSHSTFAQDGWEQVADYSLDWAVRNART